MKKLAQKFLVATSFALAAGSMTGCMSANDMEQRALKEGPEYFSKKGYQVLSKKSSTVRAGQGGIIPSNYVSMHFGLKHKETGEYAEGYIEDMNLSSMTIAITTRRR